MNQKSNQELIDLYEASTALGQLKWWEFYNSELPIVVKVPHHEESCCVFSLEEAHEKGIIIYFGDEGIQSLKEIQKAFENGKASLNYTNATFRQVGFQISFENRADLESEEYAQIKRLGIQCRGRKQWPKIRQLSAGALPTPVNQISDMGDIQRLTIILGQLKTILEEIKTKKLVLKDDSSIQASQESGQWKYKQTPSQLLFERELSSPYGVKYQNDLTIHRLKKLKKKNLSLEGTQVIVPIPSWNEELNQEVLPMVTFFANQKERLVSFIDTLGHQVEDLAKINDQLADIILNKLKFCPTEIIVSDRILLDIIFDFCRQVGIECRFGETKDADFLLERFLSDDFDEEIEEVEEFIDFFDEANEEAFWNLYEEDEEEAIIEFVTQVVVKRTDEIYLQIMNETSAGKLPLNLKKMLKEILESMLIKMSFPQGIPPIPISDWTKADFKKLIRSRYLENDFTPQTQKYIYPLTYQLLIWLEEINLMRHSKKFIKIVEDFYG